MSWKVYIIRTKSGKLYTGITTDLERRFNEHRTKSGAQFFNTSAPDYVVYTESYPNRSEATKREIEIKKMSRSQKITLID
ncbi:MAG TPA: GIY-YIG nuclease family protein [Chlamydiales bacterium]|nr:GIY-YIG nuclease family protein [Chlamydiales bacterium]